MFLKHFNDGNISVPTRSPQNDPCYTESRKKQKRVRLLERRLKRERDGGTAQEYRIDNEIHATCILCRIFAAANANQCLVVHVASSSAQSLYNRHEVLATADVNCTGSRLRVPYSHKQRLTRCYAESFR